MGNVTLNGSTSGQITLAPTAVAGTNTLTLPAVTGTVLASSSGTITVPSGSGTAAVQGLSTNIVSGTVNAGGTSPFPSSGGPTSVLFTGIPSWVRRVTINYYGVNTSGSNYMRIQFGTSGGLVTSGYVGYCGLQGTNNVYSFFSNGFLINQGLASGSMQFTLTDSSNGTWTGFGNLGYHASNQNIKMSAGGVVLSGTLSQISLDTNGSADTYSAGKINILYE